jgi:hypothetical protein
MDLVGPFVLAAVLAAGSIWTYRTSRARAAAVVALARELGLHYVAGGLLASGRLIGRYRGVPVEIEYLQRARGDTNALHTRVLAFGVDPAIQLSGEHIGNKLLQTFAGSDFRTGDATFDDAVDVRGPVHALVGLLDAETRAAVAAFMIGGHHVSQGVAVAELQGHRVERAAVLPPLEEAVRIAERLRPGFLSDDALARIAIEDLEPGIRRNALAALRWTKAPNARDAHQAARDDWDPLVRIDALFYLREYAAIETQRPADVAAWAALESDAGAHLVRRFTNEPLLLGLLGYAHLHELACARLAAVGGAGALESLRTYASGMLGSGRSARATIEAIHARLGHAPGSLSITSADGGELSEAHRAGGLSPPPPVASRPHPPPEEGEENT